MYYNKQVVYYSDMSVCSVYAVLIHFICHTFSFHAVVTSILVLYVAYAYQPPFKYSYMYTYRTLRFPTLYSFVSNYSPSQVVNQSGYWTVILNIHNVILNQLCFGKVKCILMHETNSNWLQTTRQLNVYVYKLNLEDCLYFRRYRGFLLCNG